MKKQAYLCAVLMLLSLVGFSEDTLSLRLVNGQAEVRFQSLSNWQYTVEFSTNLITWIPLEDGIFEDGYITCTNQSAGQQKCFYRTKRFDEFSISINPGLFNVGNEWTYSLSENDAGTVTNYIMVDRVDGHSIQNGFDVADLGHYLNGTEWLGTEYLLRDVLEGVFYVGSNDPTDGLAFSDSLESIVCKRFVPGVQTSLELPALYPYDSRTLIVTTSIGYGDITVPAGTFHNTVRVEWRESGTIHGSDYTVVSIGWYARDVGLVKTVESISGPYFYEGANSGELVSYKLK